MSNNKEYVTIIDPPSGWKYGFPKILPNEFNNKNFDLKNWLLMNNYPENDIDLAIQFSRYWCSHIDEKELPDYYWDYFGKNFN